MPSAKRLRSFVYLNDDVVSDYLAQLEGAILEGPYTETDTSTGAKEGGGKLRLHVADVGGQMSRSQSSETLRTLRETPAARFARLHDTLEGEQMIQHLDGFDLEIYDQIEIGEIVEIRGIGRLPRWERIARAASDFAGLFDIMRLTGQDPLEDPKTRVGFEGLNALAAKKDQEGTALLLTPRNAPEFTILAKLEASRLTRKEDLEAEVTILAKVQRILQKGETFDVFRLLPEVNDIVQTMEHQNRAARRTTKRQSGKKSSDPSPLDEQVKYPALVVQPIAVYL